MNALQRLIQDWIDAEPGRSERSLARKAGLGESSVNAIMRRDDPVLMPRTKTRKVLAQAMGLPERIVHDAAAAAATFRVEASSSAEVQGWLALLEELPADRREELWEIGRMYLQRVKDRD